MRITDCARRTILVAAGLAAGTCTSAGPTIDAGRMGRVHLFEPAVARRGLVFLFSGDTGWDAGLEAAAQALARRGAAVAGVDLPDCLARLAASDDGCHYVVSDLEDLSKRLQRELGFTVYRSPIVAGVGAGATLAYAALAQSPAATLAGGAGVEPLPTLTTRVPLCAGAAATPAAGGGFRYAPLPNLPGWWEVVPGGPDAAQRLVATIETRLAPAASQQSSDGLGGIPITELPAHPPGDTVAVIYSGDGGWRDLDKQIGELLARSDVPVVGIDSLRYFWRAREPDALARDLERILAHYGERWNTRRTLLVGYSFGADVLPFIVNRLSADARATIVQVSLLGLGSHASFEFHVSAWLGAGPRADEPAILPEAARLDLARVQCFYGADEDDTLCPELARRGAEAVRTAGGHHFDGDYAAVARRIRDGLERRATVRR